MEENYENLIKQRPEENEEEGREETREIFRPGMKIRLKPEFAEEWGLNGKEMISKDGKILNVGPTHIQIRWRKSLVVEIPLNLAEQELEIIE